MYAYKLSQTAIILRVVLNNSSTGLPYTGLSSTSAGLNISTIADSEATATVYTQAASHIGTITTLGTYAAPSASSCNFKEVDATNLPGLYEIQLANARFAVSGAKSLTVGWGGVTNLKQDFIHIALTDMDPYNRAAQFQKQTTEGYAADGTAPTVEQFLYAIQQFQQEKNKSGTAITIKGIDGSTVKMGFTLDDATTPNVITRSS